MNVVRLAGLSGLLCMLSCSKVVTPALAEAPEFEPEGQTLCSIAASQDNPLVVEWPSADRAMLEAKAQRQIVVVRYQGCELEVLPRCVAPGEYDYTSVAPKRDGITIRNADELFANVPAGAVRLEGKLEAAGELNIEMMMVGRLEAQALPSRDQLEGECRGATHVMAAMTVGAFEFYAGSRAEAGASALIANAGAGARGSSSKETLTQDGTLSACIQSDAPPTGCSAPLRIEVVRLSHAATATATAVAPAPTTPPIADVSAASVAAPSVCPDGTVREGEACVHTRVVERVECPSGAYWNGSSCVTPTAEGVPTPLVDDDAHGDPWYCWRGRTKNGDFGECDRDEHYCGGRLAQRKRKGTVESSMRKCSQQRTATCFQLRTGAAREGKSWCFPDRPICERNFKGAAAMDGVEVISGCGDYE